MKPNAAAYVRIYVHSALHGAPQYRAANRRLAEYWIAAWRRGDEKKHAKLSHICVRTDTHRC